MKLPYSGESVSLSCPGATVQGSGVRGMTDGRATGLSLTAGQSQIVMFVHGARLRRCLWQRTPGRWVGGGSPVVDTHTMYLPMYL